MLYILYITRTAYTKYMCVIYVMCVIYIYIYVCVCVCMYVCI
uniref:Uncharacterized protein n=1 Tax=Anguilla anguilla TaxID=7936 RepID=A0A0E9Q108_ANGAN